jgi:TetR/AcrR family transcriptional regulator, cholesterol catabolism regulator
MVYICAIMENKESKDIRKQIMLKAESMFMRLGIKSVSMDDIARELGISKKTLYQYFENKEALILQAIEAHIQDERCGIENLQQKANDAVEEMMEVAKMVIGQYQELSPSAIYDLRKYYPEAWQMIDTMQQQYIYSLILQNLQRGIADGDYRTDFDPDIMARIYVGSIELPINFTLFPIREYQPEQVFKTYIYHFMRGIVSTQGLDKMNGYMAQKQAMK